MTKLEKIKQELPACILQYVDAKGISQNKLANEFGARSGVSSSLLSQIVNGHIDSVASKKLLLIWDKVKPQEAQIYTTSDMTGGVEACKAARQKHMMIAIIADTGMSKTTILEAVAAQRNTYYMYLDRTTTTAVFMRELLQKMGVAFEGNQHAMLQKIVAELKTQVNPLLLIDECAKMSDKLMLDLHSINDQTKHNCGIVLAGMPDFKIKIDKFANKQKMGYSEFRRRVRMWHELEGLTRKEVRYILEQNNIPEQADGGRFLGIRYIGELMNEIELYKEVQAN